MASTTQENIFHWANTTNASINLFCSPILSLNLLLVFILSLSWLVCILRQLMNRNKKLKLRMIRNYKEWREMLNNHNSYRIRDMFLIMICLCESAQLPIILAFYIISGKLKQYKAFDKSISGHDTYSFERGFYLSLFHFDFRLFRALIVVQIYCLIVFVRILTQFLVHKYSFYKYNLKLITKLGISLSFLLVLFISGLFRKLMIPFYIIIAFALLLEYLVLVKVTRQLRRLLKQRLTDALNNESVDICIYYKIVYGNYKCFSVVLLLSLFFQCAFFFIFCIHSVVVTILAFPNDWFAKILYLPEGRNMFQFAYHPNVILYNLIVSSIQEILFTIGFCIQTVPYLFVSALNLFRSIKKRIKGSSINTILIQRLIDKHNNDYEQNH